MNMRKWSYAFIFTLLSLSVTVLAEEGVDILHPSSHEKRTPKKVAIVGAGVAGTSSAYFLRQKLGEKVDITVYEKNPRVGGRTHHINYDGVNIEVGGAVYYYQNWNVKHFANITNMTEISMERELSRVGIWNGKEFVFQDSPWFIVTALKVLYRYGLGIFKAESYATEVKEKFLQIYDFLKNGTVFDSVEQLYSAVGLQSITKESIEEALSAKGVSQTTIDEIVTLTTRINYNQNKSLNALAGSICLIGSGGDFVMIEEGLETMYHAVLNQTKSNLLLQTTVNSVEHVKDANQLKYKVVTENGKSELYDAVIVAAPLEFANLSLPTQLPSSSTNRPYQVTHVYIIAGELNPKYFGFEKQEDIPSLIATVEDDNIPFSSIALKTSPPQTKYPSYKIFSRKPLNESTLNSIYNKIEFQYHTWWHAYPRLQPSNAGYPPMVLDGEHLYYVNAMETPFSTMESESLGAENMVNLLLKRFF